MSIIDDFGSLVHFGDTFQRNATVLINRAADDIFNSSADSARQTVVVVYNRTDNPIFFIDSNFDSGGFTSGKQAPFQIAGKTAEAYRVESHGLFTGVTGAHIRYGLFQGVPSSVVLDINTSNPFVGSNHSEANAFNVEGFGFGVVLRDSLGNSNQVDIDFFVPGFVAPPGG